MPESVDFIVGNSYNKIPRSKADFDKSGRFQKIHDWTLYVDIINGSPDVIERVCFDLGSSFTPSIFTCASPIKVKYPNGNIVWRFKTRQQSYGAITATLTIRGCGGTLQKITHKTLLQHDSELLKSPTQNFVEPRPLKALKPLKIDDLQQFGIELELTSANYVGVNSIADMINNSNHSRQNNINVDVINSYSEGRATTTNWKIVPDSSIQCSTSSPDCNKFELVSPILMGGSGLNQINKILKQLDNVEPKLKVNKSMGYHVHIDVNSFSHDQLVKISQNFIKYEDAIDTFMPLSRRSGSLESDQYFKSNRQSIFTRIIKEYGYQPNKGTNRLCHDKLQETNSIEELVNLMNSDGRYFKLNLQNLLSGRQPTIEFRQHSATVNYEKVSYWIRFCVAFVLNSAKLPSPTPFADNKSIDNKLDALFQFVIKDRALRDFYLDRRQHLSLDEGDSPCCTCCSNGERCAKRKRH